MRLPLFILFLVLIQACTTENKKDYQLTTSVSPSEAGTITPENGFFTKGDSLEITASPNDGWIFDKWEGDISGSENPTSIIVDRVLDITAMFTERPYPLTLEIVGKGTVSEKVIQQKSTDREGTVVQLTANPAEGWSFSKWSGEINGTDPQQEITITGATNVIAFFTNNFVKTYGGSDSDRAYSSAYTNDGGLVLTGVSTSDNGDFAGLKKSGNFIYVMKLTDSGEVEWVKTFTGSEHAEGATSIIQTTDGGFALTGYTRSNSAEFNNTNRGREDIFVIKLNSTGDTEWIKTLGGSYNDFARTIIETEDGSLIVGGYTSSLDGDFQGLQMGHIDGFLIKLQPNGETQWVKTYGGSEVDYIFSITSTNDNGFVFTGSTESEDGDLPGSIEDITDAYVMKTDINGNIEWFKKFGGNHEDTPLSIISSDGGGTIITGATFSHTGDFVSPDNGFQKPFVIKLDHTGEAEWLSVYEGDVSMIRGRSVVETQTGDLMIAAYANSNTEVYHTQIQVTTRILVMKVNSSGNLEWMKIFEGSDDDSAYSITKSDYNTFFITGASNSTDGFFSGLNKGSNDIFVIQLDGSGKLVSFE